MREGAGESEKILIPSRISFQTMTCSLTGTPGVGKTSVSDILREKGYEILDLNEFIEKNDLKGEKDEDRRSFEVDTEGLREVFEEREIDADMIEGHLSHYLPVSFVIVLRCSPSELQDRMEKKGWSEEKIEENVEAEMLDTILLEALDMDSDVYEIDTTSKTPEKVAENVTDIISGEEEDYEPGSVDWSDELLQKG